MKSTLGYVPVGNVAKLLDILGTSVEKLEADAAKIVRGRLAKAGVSLKDAQVEIKDARAVYEQEALQAVLDVQEPKAMTAKQEMLEARMDLAFLGVSETEEVRKAA